MDDEGFPTKNMIAHYAVAICYIIMLAEMILAKSEVAELLSGIILLSLFTRQFTFVYVLQQGSTTMYLSTTVGFESITSFCIVGIKCY